MEGEDVLEVIVPSCLLLWVALGVVPQWGSSTPPTCTETSHVRFRLHPSTTMRVEQMYNEAMSDYLSNAHKFENGKISTTAKAFKVRANGTVLREGG